MKKKTIAILGSTGSIGQSTLELIKKSNEFEVKTGGFDYGVCELTNSKGKNNIEFKPIIDDKTKIVIEMLFV